LRHQSGSTSLIRYEARDGAGVGAGDAYVAYVLSRLVKGLSSDLNSELNSDLVREVNLAATAYH
jgi:hypothetical protein